MAKSKSNKQKSADRARQQAAAQRADVQAKMGDAAVVEEVSEEEAAAAKAAAAAEKEAARQERIKARQAEIEKAQKQAAKAEKKAKDQAAKRAVKTGNELDEYRKTSTKVEKKDNAFKRLWKYLKDVKAEMSRVTWPSKQEVWRMSLVVIIALIFFGLLFYAVDSILAPLMVQFGKLA